jgi:hypothetical protein
MTSAQKAHTTMTATVILTQKHFDLLSQFAGASGKTLDEAISFGLSRWMPLEAQLTTEMLLDRRSKPAKRAPKRKTVKILMFPTTPKA